MSCKIYFQPAFNLSDPENLDYLVHVCLIRVGNKLQDNGTPIAGLKTSDLQYTKEVSTAQCNITKMSNDYKLKKKKTSYKQLKSNTILKI